MENRYQFDRKKYQYEFFLFLLWSILTLSAACAHEPWRDEVQAFLIARDLSLSGIFEQLKYEGHFLLWFLFLKLFAVLGIDFLPFISWGLTAAALGVFLFRAPFSRIFKTAVCLSSPFLFWYPIVSRCYALIPPLLFLTAVIFPKRKEHPVLYGILIALLTNTHIIAEGIVLFLFLHAVCENWRTKEWDCRAWIAPCIMCTGVLVGFITAARALFYPASLPSRMNDLFAEGIFFLNCIFLRERYLPFDLLPAHVFPILLLCGCLLVYLKRSWRTAVLVLILFAISVWTRRIIGMELFVLFLMVGILFGKQNPFFVTGLLISVLWLFVTVWFLCPMLPQRALSVLFFLLFFAWTAYGELDRKQSIKAVIFRQRVCKDMLPLFLITLVSGGFLLYTDLNAPFSGIRSCGRFLSKLPREYEICTLSMSDGIPMVSAWSGKPVNLLPVKRNCTFYPREYGDIGKNDPGYFARCLCSSGKKAVVAYSFQRDIAEFLQRLSYYKIYESPRPFAVPKESFCVYVHASNLRELQSHQ